MDDGEQHVVAPRPQLEEDAERLCDRDYLMMRPIDKSCGILALCVLLLVAASSIADTSFAQGKLATEERPFVEHRAALQLSDRDPNKQTFILSMANKMLEVYGPDAVDIQIVVIGAGIELAKADSPYRGRVDSPIAQGATFNACS